MASPGSKVLSKMLDRLLAGLMSGPNMNCRPAKSRQRVDLTQLIKLQDIPAEEIIHGLLGDEKKTGVIARVKLPKKPAKAPDADPAEFPAEKPWLDQSAILSKLRMIADDARTYENDTGVHALSIGFPLLSLPPGTFAGAARTSTKRILAPIAFIPVTLSMKGGPTPSVELSCHSDGADRVVPNTALLSWIEQQTGKPQNAEGFDDEEGIDPWREICELVAHAATAMRLPVPELFAVQAAATTGGAEVQTVATPEPAPPPPRREFKLQPATRSDDEADQPAIILSAVLGLFPTAHQGLVRDTRAMIAEPGPFAGPIQTFLTSGIDFDTPVNPTVSAPTKLESRALSSERLAAAADPCQARAVALARESAGLVVHGPPGTGKSQTITNIISDHLARGQRVLLVCDKRTALDVVADRLEHMGLRSLCGIVHDPQRDQRDLYRAIHRQLDELPEAKTSATAEPRLAKVDAELQQLHDELTTYQQSLMNAPAEGGPPFHELMGRWMSYRTQLPVKLDASATANVSLELLESQQPALWELFERAGSVDFSRNLWAKCAGVSLPEFLSRPMAGARTAMARIVATAQSADAVADPKISAFGEQSPVQQQATARAHLAEELAEIIADVHSLNLLSWAKEKPQAVEKVIEKLQGCQPSIATAEANRIDAELLAFLQPIPPLTELSKNLLAVQQYLTSAKKWWGVFAFTRRSEAAAVLKQFALARTPANAERVEKFLLALTSRIVITTMIVPFNSPTLPSDDQIELFIKTASKWFPLLNRVLKDPALEGIAPLLAKASDTEPAMHDLLEGFRLSTPRADAIVRLEAAIDAGAIFAPEWLATFAAGLKQGKLAAETALALAETLDMLEGVLRVRAGRGALPAALGLAADQLLSQIVSAEDAVAALQQQIVAGEITRRLRENPTLHAIDAHRIESGFTRFRELDQQKKKLVRDVITHQWVTKQKDRLLANTGSRLNAAGADLRRRLTSRGQRAMRLRQVIAIGEKVEGGDPLFDLCPVWMASPETVAQIFPRKAVFDVIVFDEASQCRLEEALPVLTRGHRVVIAGDPNQLPPTRFFESGLVQSEDDEPETDQELFESQQGEVEDLLAAALNLAIQQCYLDVHYRSRNSDLIEFSNHNFYANRLQAIPAHPANRSKFSPLTLYRVDGTYNKRQNEAEADRVVQIVKDLLKRATPPSIGIACLNLPQRDLIVEKLDDLAGEDADFGKRLAAARIRKGQGSFEGLFVKNLENVQGDERDDIIISTTYGPDNKGKFYRRFGPLGMAGGGRRLNVLVTRARREVHLVTSIPVESYRNLPAIPEGQSATGAWLLFAYLKYAESLAVKYSDANIEQSSAGAVLAEVNVLPSESPSLFSRNLAESLAGSVKLGSDVHWGNEGFCVDLAMHDPDRPSDVTIGVLCDGCRYMAADDPLEWDIFRTGVLEDQGWMLKRIWTPHFFRDPQGNVDGILKAAGEFVEREKKPVRADADRGGDAPALQ